MTTDTPTPTPAPLVILNDQHLSDVVHALASKQLALNEAEAKVAGRIELLKKAFSDSTAETAAELKAGLEAIEAYAKTNRDRLFPVKGKKQVKTHKVLDHKLTYRSSTAVEAVSDAAESISKMVEVAEKWNAPDGLWNGIHKTDLAAMFRSLLRTPPQELSKERLLAMHEDDTPADRHVLEYLHLNGIRVKTTESFKVSFNFKPEAEAES